MLEYWNVGCSNIPFFHFPHGPLCAVSHSMKRAAFKLHPARGGWIRTTLAPINDKHEARFGVIDTFMFMGLVAIVITVARLIIAH